VEWKEKEPICYGNTNLWFFWTEGYMSLDLVLTLDVLFCVWHTL